MSPPMASLPRTPAHNTHRARSSRMSPAAEEASLCKQPTAALPGGSRGVLFLDRTEKGPWAAVLQEGREAFLEGDYDGALLAYLRAAEMGLELGQSNAAWLLTNVRTERLCSCGASSLQPDAWLLINVPAKEAQMPS